MSALHKQCFQTIPIVFNLLASGHNQDKAVIIFLQNKLKLSQRPETNNHNNRNCYIATSGENWGTTSTSHFSPQGSSCITPSTLAHDFVEGQIQTPPHQSSLLQHLLIPHGTSASFNFSSLLLHLQILLYAFTIWHKAPPSSSPSLLGKPGKLYHCQNPLPFPSILHLIDNALASSSVL